MRLGWRLGATLILFAATAVVLHLAPPVKGTVNPVSLYALPMRLGTWSGAEGVPENVLPTDPNEKLSVRRTYRDGNHVAWVSVALFASRDGQTQRASINKTYPQRHVTLIEPVLLTVALNGPAASPVALPAVIIHQDSRRLLVAYWHQIGNQVYGNEYRYRFALLRELIFARHTDSLLVRIATTPGPDPHVADDLAVVVGLAPSVYAALGEGIGK